MKFKLEWENSDGKFPNVEIEVPSELIDLVQEIEYAVRLYREGRYTLADQTRRKLCEDLETLIESKG